MKLEQILVPIGKTIPIALLLMLLVSPSKCIAETLRGTVKDSLGYVIPNATVKVQSTSSSVSLRADTYGVFESTAVSSPAIVTVSATGFAGTSITWSGESALTIILRPEQVQQQIVLTATRTEIPLAEVPSFISRVSREDIETSPSQQLDDVIRQIPGFSLFRRTSSRTANPTSQGVSLRGLGASGASRALVTFDGIPLNDPFGGWVYWDRIPSTDIASVEVLRGGASALYGSGALAGVIGIARRDLRNRAVSIDLSGGGQESLNGSASLTEQLGLWSLSASAQGMHTDGYIPVPKALRGRVDSLTNLRFGTGRLTLVRQFSFGTAFVTGDLFNESRNNGTLLQTNTTRVGEGAGGVDASLGGGVLNLRTYVSAQNFNQTFSSITADRDTESLVRVQSVPAQQGGFSVVWNRKLGSRNTFAVGGDFRRVTGRSDELLWGPSSPTGSVQAGGRQIYFGAFVEDMLQLTPRLRVSVAGRADTWRNYNALSRSLSFASNTSTTLNFQNHDKAAFSPSLGGVLQVTRILALTGSAYGSFRGPSLNELYRVFRLGNVLTLANEGLNPERLRGSEGGVMIGSAPVFLRAVYFWNTVHDAIGNRTISTTAALITRQRQNLGDIVSQGVEVELEARLSKRIQSRTGYMYSDSTISRSTETSLLGLRVPQVPSHAVTQSVVYGGKRWSGTVATRYIAGQFEDDLNRLRLPGYFSADAMVRWRFSEGVEPFIACENLLDRTYLIGRSQIPTVGSPRLVRAGVRFQFGSPR
jgi:outer membrane receptor protein involved in Fe transport